MIMCGMVTSMVTVLDTRLTGNADFMRGNQACCLLQFSYGSATTLRSIHTDST